MAKIWKLAIKNIYIWIIKHYTDIDRKQSEKKRFWGTFEDTKEVFRSHSLWELSKGLNIFYEKGPFYCASIIIV